MSDMGALVRALPYPALVVNGDERIISANAPMLQLLGADCEGWHYITALRQPAVLDAIEETRADGGVRTARYLGKDGARDTSWDVTTSLVPLSDGDVTLVCFLDVTALEDAGAMRRDFVANVSHEMRTPLTSLLGFIETLRGPARDDKAAQDRFLGIMEQEAGRMHRLVEDLLSLSRVEDQQRDRPDTWLHLGPLLREVADSLAPQAQEAGVNLTLDLPDQGPEIPGDREQLWQVISNLLENGIKYGKPMGTVWVTLTGPAPEPGLRSEGVRITVRDEGEGIAAHHIGRLTERFYRVDSHRSREVGGTGLGLAITKHIINRHRGRLRIDSTPGQGAEFTVILPATLPE